MYEQLFAAQFSRPVATLYKCAKTDVRTPVAILKLAASMFFVYNKKVGKSSPEHPCSRGKFTRNAPAGYLQGKRRFCCFYQGYGFHRFRCHIPSRADEARLFRSPTATQGCVLILLSCAITFCLHHGVNFIDWVIPGFLLNHGFRGIGIVQPVSHSGHRIQRLAIGNGFHRAAVGVSADDDIRHAKCDNRVFNRSRYATGFRSKKTERYYRRCG